MIPWNNRTPYTYFLFVFCFFKNSSAEGLCSESPQFVMTREIMEVNSYQKCIFFQECGCIVRLINKMRNKLFINDQ